MKKQTLIRKSAAPAGAPVANTPAKATRRLDDIQTREVSLVDHAANGRTFLVVKRAGVQKDADKNILKGNTEEAQPATTSATPAEQTPELLPVEKGVFGKAAEAILNKLPVRKSLAWPQKEMFFAMADALSSFTMGMDMISSDIMAFMNSDGKTGFMGVEVVKSALAKEFPEASEAELIEKAGKKMKKDRWMKMKKVHDDLGALLKELDETETQDVTKGGTDMKTQTAPAGTPAAPAAAAPAAQAPAAASTEATVTKQDAPVEAPAAPAAAAPAAPAAPAAQGVTAEQVAEIVTKSVKEAVAPLQKEIETLKNAPVAPAGEGTSTTEEVVTKNAGGAPAKKESIFKGVL